MARRVTVLVGMGTLFEAEPAVSATTILLYVPTGAFEASRRYINPSANPLALVV